MSRKDNGIIVSKFYIISCLSDGQNVFQRIANKRVCDTVIYWN